MCVCVCVYIMRLLIEAKADLVCKRTYDILLYVCVYTNVCICAFVSNYVSQLIATENEPYLMCK